MGVVGRGLGRGSSLLKIQNKAKNLAWGKRFNTKVMAAIAPIDKGLVLQLKSGVKVEQLQDQLFSNSPTIKDRFLSKSSLFDTESLEASSSLLLSSQIAWKVSIFFFPSFTWFSIS